ncbi:MAG: hypothetical protein A3F68_02250 [Acidobacteria bacterium RIFCSPLOWO2_12_FULL_54_10]|nr:MAG: hypothetical protein A3F68_02250 [Acidobacteria bacterium RIFCSPLOWO2_12_FULL_54_10]
MQSLYLIRNALSNTARVLVTGVLGFAMTPIVYHRLGNENYAIFIFALSVVAIAETFEAGLSSALVRYVSKLAAQGQKESLHRLASTVYFVLAGLGVLGSAIIFFQPNR